MASGDREVARTDSAADLIASERKVRAFLQDPKTLARIASVLPNVGITPERFLGMFLTAFNRNPALWKCDLKSILSFMVLSAQSGLSPSGISGECYPVPFFNSKKRVSEVVFVPGYRGLLKVARRTGDVLSVAAEVVYQGDEFEYAYGSNAGLRHVPKGPKRDKAAATHAWALAKLKGGGEQFVVLTVSDVEKIRAKSKAGTSGPWVDYWDEMAKKTALRRLSKYLPISDDDYRLVEAAGREEAGESPVIDLGVGDFSIGEPRAEEPPAETEEPRALEEGQAPAAAADGTPAGPAGATPAAAPKPEEAGPKPAAEAKKTGLLR